MLSKSSIGLASAFALIGALGAARLGLGRIEDLRAIGHHADHEQHN